MDCHCINLVYVRVHINMRVRELDIVPVMERYVMASIQNVIALHFMIGREVHVYIHIVIHAQMGIVHPVRE